MNIMIHINLSPCHCTITAYIIYSRCIYRCYIEACIYTIHCHWCVLYDIAILLTFFSFILKTFTSSKGVALHVRRAHSKYVFSSFLNSIMAMGLNVVSSGAYTGSVRETNPLVNVNREKRDMFRSSKIFVLTR